MDSNSVIVWGKEGMGSIVEGGVVGVVVSGWWMEMEPWRLVWVNVQRQKELEDWRVGGVGVWCVDSSDAWRYTVLVCVVWNWYVSSLEGAWMGTVSWVGGRWENWWPGWRLLLAGRGPKVMNVVLLLSAGEGKMLNCKVMFDAHCHATASFKSARQAELCCCGRGIEIANIPRGIEWNALECAESLPDV